MEDLEKGMAGFISRYGKGKLEMVIMPVAEFEVWEISLAQKYPHIKFVPDEIHAYIFIHKGNGD